MEEKYRPLSPWSYFLYTVLFSLPVFSIIFLLIFSFNSKNINRRNFARSFFCGYLVFALLAVVLIILSVIFKFDFSNFLIRLKAFF